MRSTRHLSLDGQRLGFSPSSQRRALAGAVWLAVMGCLLSISYAGPAEAAIQVLYQVEDVGNAAPLEDQWRYTYRFEGHTFGPGQILTVIFSEADYVLLQPAPEAHDWLTELWEAEDDVQAQQAFVAQAQTTVGPGPIFAVNFLWLATDGREPGSQPFKLLDENFETLAQDETTAVPEPTTWLMLAAGLLALGAGLRRRALAGDRRWLH